MSLATSHDAQSRLCDPRTGSWLQSLDDWLPALLQALLRECAVVRVLVAAVRGSAPREAGACMLIGQDWQQGTIGGGRLEWQALAAARAMLADADSAAAARQVKLERLVLGADRAQCCGGRVDLWLERYTRADLPWLRRARADASGVLMTTRRNNGEIAHRLIARDAGGGEADGGGPTVGIGAPKLLIGADGIILQERLAPPRPQLWLYGAGHVGQALLRVMAPLPLQLTWLDARAELVPPDLPANVTVCVPNDPPSSVARAPRATHFLIMTHSHALDYVLCHRILQRADFGSIGVIGSASKGARFRARLAREGIPPAQIARLRCPIGLVGIDSKLPAAIAVAVAAEWLQLCAAGARSPQPLLAQSGVATDCAGRTCEACAGMAREPAA